MSCIGGGTSRRRPQDFGGLGLRGLHEILGHFSAETGSEHGPVHECSVIIIVLLLIL